jgi:TRL-like protein family
VSRLVGIWLLVLTLVLSGCTTGLIYTHITTPLDVNFNNTPVFTGRGETGKGDIKRFRYYIEIDWESNAIGDIMKRTGLKEVHYADLETLSVLGIWTQQWVIVYGR